MPSLIQKLGQEDYDKRLRAARARAGWELGDPSWANVIIHAFEFPTGDAQMLREEKARYDD